MLIDQNAHATALNHHVIAFSMFDKIQVTKHETRVTPVTRVIEKSITPDKVVEMYDKTEEEVRKNLIQKIVIQDNSFNGSITIWDNPNRMVKEIVVHFTLNGKEFTQKEQIIYSANLNNEDFLNATLRAIQNAVMKELFDKLAAQLPH